MKQKYQKDDIVYSYYFDWKTSELKFDTLIVYNYEYLDGMQWNIIDEYALYKVYEIPYFKFWKKKKQKLIRLPGLLISDDNIVAKIKLLHHLLNSFGYILDSDSRSYSTEKNLLNIVENAKKELDTLSYKYPEKFFKAINFIPVDKNNYTYWR